ncbi:hypothetical protein MMC26_006865 [Xylographa opegraphella]|nr:hypothetical protein [Xylographa opegraphella]
MAGADTEYLRSIPWCAKLLADPDFVLIPTSTRTFKKSTEDALFAETLKTSDTIQAWIALFRQPAPEATKVQEVHTIVSLGHGLNGYPHICHGGIVATLMDEVMSTLLSVNKSQDGVSGGAVTASLNVRFMKPVWTPQVVLVTATFGDIKGRKLYLEAMVRDNSGIVLAKAEALFMRIDESTEKL